MNYQQLINAGIKRLRIKQGLTQDKFAELVNLSVQGLRNLEHNKYQPTADTVDRICNVFKITPIELLLEDSSKDKTNIINKINVKLKTLDSSELLKINDFIDLIKKQY